MHDLIIVYNIHLLLKIKNTSLLTTVTVKNIISYIFYLIILMVKYTPRLFVDD